jgi:Holliday junction resolvasome RuvABC DNA-binding subunit
VNDQNLLANSIQLNVWQNQKSKKGIYLEYKEAEDLLLKYLDANERISFSSFCKLAGISRRKASVILSKLASLNIISIVFTEKQTFYELKKKD